MYGKPLRPPGILVRYGAEGRLFSDILKSGIKRRKRLKKLYLDYHIYDRYRKQTDSDEDVILELEGREQILVLKGIPAIKRSRGRAVCTSSLRGMSRRSPSMRCHTSASSEGTKRAASLP